MKTDEKTKITVETETPVEGNDEMMQVGDIWMPKSEWMEWVALTDEKEVQRGADYRKKCQTNGVVPTPPSKWLKCPGCGYRAPESLVSHIKKEHGGVNALARSLGMLPEQIKIVSPQLLENQRTTSIRIAAKIKADKEAAKESAA